MQGQENTITPIDLTVMDALGYSPIPEPTPLPTLALLSLLIPLTTRYPKTRKSTAKTPRTS